MNQGSYYGFPVSDPAVSGISIVTPTTSSITLNAGNLGYIATAMSSIGQSVTLPDATQIAVGSPRAVIDNTKGGYPVGIRDNTGVLLMAVAAGGEAIVSLRDSSSTAGIWSVTGTNLEPGLITIDSTFSSTYTATVLAPFVALDSNTSIHFAINAATAGFAAFIVDNTGKVLGTPVAITASAAAGLKAVFKVSATSAIIFYGDGANSNFAVVITVTGTTISVGTPASATSTGFTNAYWGNEDFVGTPKVAQLTPTLYLCSFAYSGASPLTAVCAVSVSGTTVTVGAYSSIITTSSVTNSTTTYALTATTALVLYNTLPSNYNVNAVVVSVSGATCSIGTPVTSNLSSAASGGPPFSTCLLSPTKALVFADNAATTAVVAAITISGTTVSFGATTTVENSVPGFGGAGSTYPLYTGSSATRYNPHLFPLSANTALLWYLDSSGISRAVVLTESSGTVTAGVKLYNSISTASANVAGYGSICDMGTSEFCAIMEQAAQSAGEALVIQSHKISGATITQGAGKTLRDLPPNNPSTITTARLPSGDYVVIPYSQQITGANMIPVWRSNGDVVNMRGVISCPPIYGAPVASAGRPIVPGNRLVILGTTNASTINANAAWQLRLLNIEVAQ